MGRARKIIHLPGRASMTALAGALALSGIGVATAAASPNNAPSKAAPISVGVPFSGDWTDTTYAHGESNNLYHWWRLPVVVRPGDSVQVGVDNRLGESELYLCLVPPVDDFGADNALDQCSDDYYVSEERQDRIQITYGGAAGQASLAIWSYYGNDGQYAVVVERIVTRVNPGLVVPSSLPQSFSLSAPLRYGDNSPVADGVGAVLQWRYTAQRGKKAGDFVNLAGAYSAGGAVTFNAVLPKSAQGSAIQLRACASQPGSDTVVCSTAAKTTVAAPSTACLSAQSKKRSRARSVRRLSRKVGFANTRRARRVYRRKLATAERKLARAKRAARAHCA